MFFNNLQYSFRPSRFGVESSSNVLTAVLTCTLDLCLDGYEISPFWDENCPRGSLAPYAFTAGVLIINLILPNFIIVNLYK